MTILMPVITVLICTAIPLRCLLITRRYRRDFGVHEPEWLCLETNMCCEGALQEGSVCLCCCPCLTYYGAHRYMKLRQEVTEESACKAVKRASERLTAAIQMGDLDLSLECVKDKELRNAVGVLLEGILNEDQSEPDEQRRISRRNRALILDLKVLLLPVLLTWHLGITGETQEQKDVVSFSVHNPNGDEPISIEIREDQTIAVCLQKATSAAGLEHSRRHCLTFGGMPLHGLSTVHENDIAADAIVHLVANEGFHDQEEFLFTSDDYEQFRGSLSGCCLSQSEDFDCSTKLVTKIGRTPSDFDYDKRGRELWEMWLDGSAQTRSTGAFCGCGGGRQATTQVSDTVSANDEDGVREFEMCQGI